MTEQAIAIKNYILENVEKHPQDIVAITTERFKVTRTTVHRHLSKLLKTKKIIKSGTTRNIHYYLSASLNRTFEFKITPKLDEFKVLQKHFHDIFNRLPDNVSEICEYGFTEIFNNAIEHSKDSKIMASTRWDSGSIKIIIEDNGIGVFKSLYDYFHLDDLRESILQLNKGKMTTDPSDHTGEGIFFNARAFDIFEILANNLHYIRDNIENDWSLSTTNNKNQGSTVIMTINEKSTTSLLSIFKKFQEADNFAFDKTEIIVELSRIENEKLISRSQAKRITRDLDKFNHITLDFKKVKFVGQGFADEIFRVFQNKNPKIKIDYINASEDILFMITRSIPKE